MHLQSFLGCSWSCFHSKTLELRARRFGWSRRKGLRALNAQIQTKICEIKLRGKLVLEQAFFDGFVTVWEIRCVAEGRSVKAKMLSFDRWQVRREA